MKLKTLFIMAVLLLTAAGCDTDFSSTPTTIPARQMTSLEKELINSTNSFGFDLFQTVAAQASPMSWR